MDAGSKARVLKGLGSTCSWNYLHFNKFREGLNSMQFKEFKQWADIAKELGVRIVFGPGSKAPQEFKDYVTSLFL